MRGTRGEELGFEAYVLSWQLAAVTFKLPEDGLGSAVAVFQSDDVVFAQIIAKLDFDELH